jgi:DNA helicase II / ATP-dependent DNA helicase PcrA
MKLTKKQIDVLKSNHHLLVTGGPGSGKTTISIFKAADLLEQGLESYQKVLFLSFARASVSRVVEAIEHEHDIDTSIKKRIDVDTYHSFFWRILKTHGYLIGLPRKLSVLTPQRKAIALSNIRSSYSTASTEKETIKKAEEGAELNRLLFEEGLVEFDFFANGVSQILSQSQKVRELIANKYPVIIFDEFQDTNEDQWNAVKGFGVSLKMIALADPEQRIYDWIGADPKRLDHFREEYKPDEVDFKQCNHRSSATEIADFANDMLRGMFSQKSYKGIALCAYEPNKNQAYTKLVSCLLAAIKRVKKADSLGWSVAILVPTKKMTREISAVLDTPPSGLPSIYHEPYIEVEAAMLSAEVIAFSLQSQNNTNDLDSFVGLIINYLKGRGGDKPTKANLSQADSFERSLIEYHQKLAEDKKLRSNSVLVKTLKTYELIKALDFSGNPEEDWRSITQLFQDSECKRLNLLAEDAKNIRLLKRGEQIRQDFGQDWRKNGCYSNALTLTRAAFLQQHFSAKSKLEQGVLVMNMHKAKGKQFDETIIFEAWPNVVYGKIVANGGRIVRFNDSSNIDEQCTQNFRVSITRSKYKTTIITPKNDPCVLLYNR